MRLSTILKILVGIVVVLVVAVAAILFTLDLNQFKDTIAERAKAATGRDVTFAGDLDLNLGLTTSVSVDGVTVGNADWATAPEMVDIQRFEAEVAILPLLGGNIEVNRLILTGATINLERDADGQANWVFGDPAEAAPAANADSGGGGGEAFELPVIRDVLIENVTLSFNDAVSGQSQNVALERLALQGEGPNAPLTLDLAGIYNDLQFAAQGEVGALAGLGSDPLPIDLTAQALGFDIAVNGTVAQPTVPEPLNLNIAVAAADLSGLAAVAGDGLPAAGPLDLSASIAGGPAAIALRDLALTFGATDLSGEVSVDLSGAKPSVVGSLTSNRIDLTELSPAGSDAAAAPADDTATADAGPDDGKVFPSDPLPLDGLGAANADIAIAVAELVTPAGLSINDIDVNIALADGALSIDPFGMTIADSPLAGTISLADTGGTAALNIDIAAPQLNIGQLVQEGAGIEILRGSGALDIELASTGASVAALMGGLDGHATVLMDEGMVKTEGFDLIIGGLSAIMGSLFSDKQEWTVLSCLATNLQFTGGVAETVMLMDTDLVVITGEGQVDFGQEVPALTLTPKSKSATLNVALPINVGGTFADPSFKPDELAAAKTLGSLLGSTVFPPAALLAFGDLGAGDNPCVAEAAAAGEAPAEQPASNPVEAVTDTVGDVIEGGAEGVGDAVEGIGRGIRGLLGGDN